MLISEQSPEAYKRDTVFCVEATNFERHSLWRQHALDSLTATSTDSRQQWEQLSPGSMPTVATLNKRPIVVCCFWYRIDGQVVMFYEPTSELVDWKKIKAWLEKEYVHLPKWDNGHRRSHCDAQNFGDCLQAIAERNKAAAKLVKASS